MIESIFRVFARGSTPSPWNNENLVLEELFSVERLEQHAESLAVAQKVTAKSVWVRSLAARLRENEATLYSAYRAIGTMVSNGGSIVAAAEWLLDNYPLVEAQIREIRDSLPPGYYRQLPKLAEGPFAGYPRVFGVAWAFVAHTDSRFDIDMLQRFVRAYQNIQPLTIGELWAVAITLRIVLVENLRRAASVIIDTGKLRQEADTVADRLLGVNGFEAEAASVVLEKYAGKELPTAFTVQLIKRLRDQDPQIMPAVNWLEERLKLKGTSSDEVVRSEHQRQAAANVTVRNIITSMRQISDVDWTVLFESMSLVDEVLQSASDFRGMDFPTRNLYRSAIEEISRGSKLSELDIARMALAATVDQSNWTRSGDSEEGSRKRDPGYYLIGKGQNAFRRRTGFQLPLWKRLARFNIRLSISHYVWALIVCALGVLAVPLDGIFKLSLDNATLWWLAFTGLIPALDISSAAINRLLTGRFGATLLPGLQLRDGVTSDLRTMVVMPTLLINKQSIEELVQHLEVHHLGNPGGDVQFALLTDWTDSDMEYADDDQALLTVAVEGIAKLNARYTPGAGGDRFLLLHRRRIWNGAEGKWMGWERKRGKLHELNRLLRGASDTTFIPAGGKPLIVPEDVRYVITLDGDTRLPRDTVRKLVGKMAHPLNRPRFEAELGRVVEGYGILQPRVTPSLPTGREGSLFQRIFSSMSGIDPYSSAVSDLYQDLFGEGSYAGKGIYDLEVFEAALNNRVPDNTLLSHDLFEGTFARAGLASDVEVVEEFPSRYDVAVSRHHRWARGDWQLLPWIIGLGGVMTGNPKMRKVPLIGLWKMIDNLRRSLSMPACIISLMLGWSLPFQAAAIWTCFIVSTIAIPNCLPVLSAIFPRHSRITARSHFHALGADIWLAFSRTAITIIFLADQAWSMVDAIGRTLYRLCISHRHMLEWATAAHTKLRPRPGVTGFFRQMADGVSIAIISALIAWYSGGSWQLAAPFILLWIVSPVIAKWCSQSPRVAGRLEVSDGDTLALRLVARRTWRYFETFVTSADNMLPPDNFQEEPNPVIAHRTSPTNFGLYLLSVVSARDFGWIGMLEAAERMEATLATMSRLERFRGHFYNWYDTNDLRPLDPPYISSVDSGNLAGHLIALANACREWIGRPLSVIRKIAGIQDAVNLVRETIAGIPEEGFPHATKQRLEKAVSAINVVLFANSEADQFPQLLAELKPLAEALAKAAHLPVNEKKNTPSEEILYWAHALQRVIESHARDLALNEGMEEAFRKRLTALMEIARAMADAMEFGFLLDDSRKLLSIGYLVAEGKLDTSCYDLLASEARLASFVAIAKGDVPSAHWFRLGRSVTPVDYGAALISWSGSMFEYLMPSLVMRAPAGSILEQTSHFIVSRQKEYGATLGLPWGVSESAYNARDLEFTYQYSNFGVPGLGLKGGLSENTVIAPYATALATMVDPEGAVRNFERLNAIGARGTYGFYEAIDYTHARLPEGEAYSVIRAYMAHHQGMTVVAIANALLDAPMRRRFHAEPIVQATELLLQERTPRDVTVFRPRAEEVETGALVREFIPPTLRRLRSPHGATPEVHLLSNGRYTVMLTASGSGYSRLRDMAVTRWREDPVRDDWGSYIFLRDLHSGEIWSAGFQPSGAEPANYDVRFSEDKAEFIRRDAKITTKLEVIVSTEDDAEVRRLSVTNGSSRTRDIEFTSYAELVLGPAAADTAHMTFSKMFVQTEYDEDTGAILATRRRRTPDEPEVWAAHLAVIEGEITGEDEYETNRAHFLGRGQDLRKAAAMAPGKTLSNTVGTVLDPIFALRFRIRIKAGATGHIAFWTVVGSSREEVLNLIDKHRDANAFERAATLAWTQAQVQLRHLGIDADEAGLFQQLAGHVLYASRSMRSSPETIRRGSGPVAGLWAQSISGDNPIVVIRIDHIEDIPIVAQVLRAHEYWQMKQLAVDLVILNERSASYVQDLQVAIETMVRTSQSRPLGAVHGTRGSVFMLRTDLIAPETSALLLSVARVVLAGRYGTLSDQLERIRDIGAPLQSLPRRSRDSEMVPRSAVTHDLEFFNGLGGFARGGREYVTILKPGQITPAPWVNVIANPNFGFQVSVEGGGYSWSVNSRENQITPWSCDPVTDRQGEVLFIRDEDTGELWNPTALPIRNDAATYIARHGQGYSRFEHTSHGIGLDLMQFVPLADTIKISRLTIRNLAARPRKLSVTAYVEWVLSPTRAGSAPYIVTELNSATNVLFARNPWSKEFGTRVAFADLAGRQTTWTADRREFLGRNGTLDNPAALARDAASLSKRVGAGLDPCAALQGVIELKPNESVNVVFFLGDAENAAQAQALIAKYRAADLDTVLREVVQYWDDMLGTVQVKTPDRAMDIMLNRWLPYQTLVCRVWARSGFYQTSGAYGFRDQLQDGMALALARPQITRGHLLRAAARQFVEGDYQHWWLPSSGQGVRTRISDDKVWLPYAVLHYIETTGDDAVLDETAGFLDGPQLRPGQHDAFYQPDIAHEAATLFEHCARGLDESLKVGVHGLPLIGTGDWNDGMNRVGELGKGESIWLGWFLYTTLLQFAPLADKRGEKTRADKWRMHATALQDALEKDGWDGSWYLRGYFDDGTPFGGLSSKECRIDSIAQSWSVISGAANPERAARAMASVDEQLVQRRTKLALLFTPPFDKTPHDPGYIKGYPPGLRENGGQYTHAATWSIIAYAALGWGDKAAELFSLINPINHANTAAGIERYKVEPYIIAADVYSVPPLDGRGGWTWYTGSAGWVYRAALESILGFRKQGKFLLLSPCIPKDWPYVVMMFRNGATYYEITIENPDKVNRGVVRALLDRQPLPPGEVRVPLSDDGAGHTILVVLGKTAG